MVIFNSYATNCQRVANVTHSIVSYAGFRQDIVRYRGELARCADLLAFQLGKEQWF